MWPIAHLTVDDVTAIHWALVEDFQRSRDPIDPPGIRSDHLLGSAVMRPYTSLGGTKKYPSLAMSAAALFHALVLDHPFHNGNKRTALVSLVVLLDKNDHLLRVSQEELYEYVISVADHKVSDVGPDDPFRSDRENASDSSMDPVTHATCAASGVSAPI
jgi:death-on-curing family protein